MKMRAGSEVGGGTFCRKTNDALYLTRLVHCPRNKLPYCKFKQYHFVMPQRNHLTARQNEVLAFVKERQRQSGFAPTLQEIAAHFGFKSTNSVREHLRLIEKKGFLHKEPGRSRALTVVDTNENDVNSVRVPVLGRIAAGQPIVATQEVDTMLDLPAKLFHGVDLFALRVKGDSMSGAGILSGDFAVFDAIPEIKDGAIAAVVIEDETTLKRVYRRSAGLVLQAQNPAFADIEIPIADSQRARVIGLLIGIVRAI
jgi:repressor LexA